MNVFITGAAGFIGGAIARRLLEQGHAVSALVRGAPGALEALPDATVVRGDITSPDDWDDAGASLGAADAVVHAAAVRKDHELTDEQLRQANVTSGVRLLERSRADAGFLFVSSVAVHGHPEDVADESAPFAPTKRYGVSKVEAEEALLEAAGRLGREVTIVRPGITYGPGDTYGMVANLARLIHRRRFLRVGNGRSCVNLIHVRDLAATIVRAVESPEARGEAFLTTGVDAVPVAELIAAVARAAERTVPPLAVPEWCARLAAFGLETLFAWTGREGEPFLTKAKVDLFTRQDVFDTAKARRVLGHESAISLDEGLAETVAWLRAHDPGFAS